MTTSRGCRIFKVKGRGQRDTPGSDVYGVVEFIMLLPGKRAAAVRRKASELFVRCHGGDLRVARAVIAARERQDELRVDCPEHAARAFGDQVEAEIGDTDEQLRGLEETLRKRTAQQRTSTSYNPATTLSDRDHEHKDCRAAVAIMHDGLCC